MPRVLTRFEKWGGLNVVAWDAQNKTEVFISRGVRLFVTIPDLGWLMLLVLAAVAAPLVLFILRGSKRTRACWRSPIAPSSSAFCCRRWRWFSSCCACAADNILRSTPTVCTPPAWPPVRSFSRRWSAASSPTCCICLLLWRREIWSAFCPTPTRSTASPTKPFASLSPCSP
jgi:hypothetical protein